MSNQIMHAQKRQKEIQAEDVLKIKVILDFVMHKVYQPIWEKSMNDIRLTMEKS